GDDVRQNPADGHTEGDHRLDRLGPGLVQKRHLNPGGIRVSAVRHGQDTSSARISSAGLHYWTAAARFFAAPARRLPGYRRLSGSGTTQRGTRVRMTKRKEPRVNGKGRRTGSTKAAVDGSSGRAQRDSRATAGAGMHCLLGQPYVE